MQMHICKHTHICRLMKKWKGQKSLLSHMLLETGISIFSHVNPMTDEICRAANNRVSVAGGQAL